MSRPKATNSPHDALILLDAEAAMPTLARRARCYGAASLSDAELVELLLGSGAGERPSRDVSHRVVAEFGGLCSLAKASPQAIADVQGIGFVKATRLCAAFEAGRRVLLSELEEEPVVIRDAACVARWARPRLGPLRHEEVWVLCLDGRNQLRAAQRISMGGVHGCALTVKDVFRPAMSYAASAIVLVHNHPSGCADPSREDLEMTRDLALAANVLGIALLDHVIVTQKGSSSLSELGVIP